MAGPLEPPDDETITLAFAMQSNPGAYALLIGAGVSTASGLPSAYQVLEDLTQLLARSSPGTWCVAVAA